ncbi:PREDICTED: GRIP and coiled-coil domain-containing protein 2-like [Dinoponera quadriceps]|uniref:GRIP and coiled-coil domain-containing protein 2-like n=1 Tax=Dinoponera quadriceps TaxID=609295 RepID=A0A6P3YBG7_DINQU|nr:PREDICTED: GRIP and coiled-coil domain-containing protein 2-like [Dinoponera quadriceps]
MFHTPMCNKLKHETQIRIKTFLENILPLGSDITKDTMKEVIMELVEDASSTPSSRQTPPLKDFVKSPIMRSAHSSYKIMTERTRELRDLRCNLDIERFKNAELQDDLKIYQEKIQNLKMKLEINTTQLKALRDERMKPNTPQPSHKRENISSCEDYYKKYIDDLEIQLSKQQDEMDNLEMERDTLSKTLASVQRQSTQYKDNLVTYERSLESLSRKMEMKDRDLIELRMHNEELRVHLRELNKNSITEQSFEIEDSVISSLPTACVSLNNSEALSSVIEIQLQEAKEESAVLQAQVDSLKGKLDVLTKNHKDVIQLNQDLQQKVQILDKVQIKLNDVQKELHTSNMDIKNLQVEKVSIIAHNEELKSLLLSREKELSETVQSNTALNTKLDNLKTGMEHLNELLGNEKTDSSDLSSILDLVKSQVTEHLTHIHKITDERDLYRSSIDTCTNNLKAILYYVGNQFIEVVTDNLDNMTLNELILYFNVMLSNYNSVCASYKCDVEKLKETIDEINANLHNQQLTVATLNEQNQQTLVELANIEKDGKQKDLLLNEQKETIHKYSQEIEVLKEIANEKCILEEDVRRLTEDLANRQLLLKSTMTYFGRLQDITKDFKLIKQEIQQRFVEYQENVKVTCERIHNNYQTLHHKLCQMKQETEELQSNFNRTKEVLADTQAINFTLQENLLQYQKQISALEEIEKFLCNDLNESKQNLQELQETNRTLEEQYTVLKIETNNNLKSLELENAKMSLELKESVVKYNVLQQDMNHTMTQIELKDAQINELLSSISSLNAEKDHLICLHEEMFAAKDKEMELKEKALQMLQNKVEKSMNEASESEKKMKEIIINLQEVRSSQDAVLTTQETALKEKCLYIEELQEQFDKFKGALKEELENEKLLHRELQVKFLALEDQIHDRNMTVEELQKKLEEINGELKVSNDHCRYMDASQVSIVKLCQELEHPTKDLNSTIIQICSDFDILDQNLYDTSQYECANNDKRTEDVLNIIKMTLQELHLSQKVISHLSFTLNETLEEQKILRENSKKDKKEVCGLRNKIRELEIITQKRNDYLNNVIRSKETLKDFVRKAFTSRNDIDTVLSSSVQKWSEILAKFQNILHNENPACDQFKQLQAKRASLENALSKYRIEHLENIKCISDILWEKFLWTEKRLQDTYLCSVHEKECLDALTNVEEEKFSDEKIAVDAELEKNKALCNNILKSEEEIQSFIALATSYEKGLESGEVKTQDTDKKLQSQISQLNKERKDLKGKIDSMRSRNVKLEKNMDDLRAELKKLKSETESTADLGEVQSLKDELERTKEQIQQLHEEKDKSDKTAKQELEDQLKEVHTTYEQKLEDMKQRMKKVYNEQMTKLNSDQEKIVREKLQSQMESMCQKQREEINKYKTHVGELSSQLWSVGEKLLIEQQQKQEALQHLKEVQVKLKEIETGQQMSTISRRTKLERQEVMPENAQQTTHKVTVITKETFERRQSVRSLQAMGNAFKAEDEEEIFDNVYLADMKRGPDLLSTDVDRLSILQMRNAQCKPHLKSSYPAEMQFLPSSLTEEEIKSGSTTEDIFNDSLSQSLLPEQKTKKKDRSQTSYKKPGPPTPSKNGGRLSLQGNELKSPNSRILRERNVDRRTTTTPHSLRHLFTLKRQDENVSSTPKGRKLSSIFRKPRMQ